MKKLAILLSFLGAFLMLCGLFQFTAYASSQLQSVTSQELLVYEMPLNPLGSANEIHADANGNLWVSDYKAAELWQVQPARGVYTTYLGLGTPSDARPDQAGYVWWADPLNQRLGRLSPRTLRVDSWSLAGSSKLYGLQLETSEIVWATDDDLPQLYRLDIRAGELCTYTLPSGTSSGYLLFQPGLVWLGDSGNSRLLQLDTEQHLLTSWQLPEDSELMGMDFDPAGNPWWANPGLGSLDQLDMQNDRLARYDIPEQEALPEMIAWIGNKLWYGEHWQRTLGVLEPQAATPLTQTLSSETLDLNPLCAPIEASASFSATITTGSLVFSANSYPQSVEQPGWAIYQLPSSGLPWGISALAQDTWLVDPGRQVLVKIPDTLPVTGRIVVQKQTIPPDSPQSFDFTSSYAGSFSLSDGQSYDSGDLQPGSYAVSEQTLPAGWTLSSATCDDGSQPGAIDLQAWETVTCLFVNSFSASPDNYLPLVVK